MIKAVLFDVNHTLIGIRDEAVSQSAAVDVLYGQVCQLSGKRIQRMDFRRTYDEAWSHGKQASFERYVETRYEDVVAWVLGQYGIDIGSEDLEFVLQTYMAPLYDAAYVIPGMDELLSELEGRVPLGVVTNYKYGSGMRGFLSTVGLSERLSAVAISSEVGWKKPDHRIYEAALGELGIQPENAVLVGNELEKDLWQAARMGLHTILFESNEHSSHDKEFAELLKERMKHSPVAADGVASNPAELRSILLQVIKSG